MKENMSQDELKKMRQTSYIKMAAMVGIVVAVIAFSSIAWFTMNREVEGSGVQMKAEGTPYVIETKGQSGYYKNKYDKLKSEAAEWQISSAHNLDNHNDAIEQDEEEPALEPGDHGSLEFRVSPQGVDTVTVSCLFEIKAYLEENAEDEDGNPTTTITEIRDTSLANYLGAHILLFADYDPTTNKYSNLIDNNNETLEKILKNQTYLKGDNTYTTIYWYWPEHLSDLTDSTNIIYDSNEHEKMIAYIARNKDGFFKDCSNSVEKVKTDLTSLYGTYSTSIYNYYNIRYDNADLEIGNGISYVILSMQVK